MSEYGTVEVTDEGECVELRAGALILIGHEARGKLKFL